MLTGALLILAPLFLGFAFALSNRRLMTVIHYTVEGLVYFILALLGLSRRVGPYRRMCRRRLRPPPRQSFGENHREDVVKTWGDLVKS